MGKNDLIIEKVRTDNPLVVYLKKKGFDYEYQHGNRYMYVCPLHGDSKPSLVVYSDGVYDNFYCFGCKKHGDVIAMHAYLNDVKWGKAFKELGGNFDVNNEEELNYLVDKLQKQYELEIDDKNAKNIFGELLFKFSTITYSYLENTNFDEDEIDFIEKLYQQIDSLVEANNLSELLKIYDFLTGENGFNPLMDRIDEWLRQKEREMTEAYINGNK